MKIKHLIIVSIILAILTIGIVSASEDIADNNTLSQSTDNTLINETSPDNGILQQINEDNNDNSIHSASNEKNIMGDYSADGVYIKIQSELDITYKYSELGYVRSDNVLKGTITLTIDGKNIFSKQYTTGQGIYFETKDLDLKKIGLGYHNVKITYNDGKIRSDSRTVNFVAIPTIDYPSKISVGEKNGITIKGLESLSGNATLYYRIPAGKTEDGATSYKKGDAIKSVNITKGYGWIPLDTLTNGSYNLQLEYNIGTYKGIKTFSLDVWENSEGFNSSLSKTNITFGQTITAILTGPRGTGDVDIYINNNPFTWSRFNSGKMEVGISGKVLTPGKHRITIRYSEFNSDLFYSTTYHVFVNHAIKLKLPKVKIKKSARLLTIKSILKIDGKIAKGKKLTYKFNNKKYTAKTDKNGVAKIKISKKILKKLKKGKKVEYSVTYAKHTVKQKVKVKK